MTGKTETRMWEIHRRTRRYRRQHETRLLSFLTVCCLFLLAGIGVLFRSVQAPGIVSVAEGYGAVLLRSDAGAYVIVGICAFVIGVSATMLCIRLKSKSKNSTEYAEESLS